jgi:hypothetical protein
MSGGHFDYVQYRIDQAADELQSYIDRCESEEVDEYGYKPDYSPETLEKFKECERMLRIGGAMLHRIDWLAEGDDGEETFHKRLADDLSKLGT